MPPTTLAAFLLWLLSSIGLSIATSAVIAAALWVWQQAGQPDPPDNVKRLVAVVVPVLLVLAAWFVQGVLHYVPWNLDNLYAALVVAVELIAGSQAAYQLAKAIRP